MPTSRRTQTFGLRSGPKALLISFTLKSDVNILEEPSMTIQFLLVLSIISSFAFVAEIESERTLLGRIGIEREQLRILLLLILILRLGKCI